MIELEELKLILTIFKDATNSALLAYVAYILYGLVKVAIVVFPALAAFKFLISRMFVSETK